MALNKIRKLDEDTVGITIPIDDARVMGLVDADGDLVDDVYGHIRLNDDHDGWSVDVIDDIGRPRLVAD